MGCAQSKCAGGGGGGAVERDYTRDGFRAGRQDKLPSFDSSSLTARPSSTEDGEKPRAAPGSALSSVSYGSLAEHRKSASRGSIKPPRVEDAGLEEGGGGEEAESGGSDNNEVGHDKTAVRLFEFAGAIWFVRRAGFLLRSPSGFAP